LQNINSQGGILKKFVAFIFLGIFVNCSSAFLINAWAAIPQDKADRISKQARLIIIQGSNRASVSEAIRAVGSPDFVIDSKNYPPSGPLSIAIGSAFTLAYVHEGCVLSYLTFNKQGQAVGAMAGGINYSSQNDKWLNCPDSTFEDDMSSLQKYSCSGVKPHKHCQANQGGNKVRDTSIDRNSLDRKAKIKALFSGWDGSLQNLEKLVKSRMYDPGSYEHVQTSYQDKLDYLLVLTTFRAKNQLGAKALNTVRAKVDFNGNVLQIVDSY
jgi:hypothetical protein